MMLVHNNYSPIQSRRLIKLPFEKKKKKKNLLVDQNKKSQT